MNFLWYARRGQHLINRITSCIIQDQTCYETSVLMIAEEKTDWEIAYGLLQPQSGVNTLFLFTFYWPELATCPVGFWGWRAYHSLSG